MSRAIYLLETKFQVALRTATNSCPSQLDKTESQEEIDMLDSRSELLFTELIHGQQNMNTQFFKEKYKWTRGQMNYSLKNINEWLLEQNYSPITRNKNGYFVIDNELRIAFKKNAIIQQNSDGYFRREQRVLLTELILLTSSEYLSTYWFIDFFQTSKNTVLRDLKIVKKEMKERELYFQYDSENGYFVQGTEWIKRNYLLELVNILIIEQKEYSLVEKICQLDKERLQLSHQLLERLEEQLKIQFSDEQLSLLTYFIPLVCSRIQRGLELDCMYRQIDFHEAFLKTTTSLELKKLSSLLELSEEEQNYFALLILSANRRKSYPLEPILYQKLEQAMRKIIEEIALFLMIEIDKKEELISKLMSHMESAYYRMKFHLTLKTADKHLSEMQHFPIYHLMKGFVAPLEEVLGEAMPDEEVFFLSIFVGSHLQSMNESNKSEKNVKKALIVCQNGIFISNYYFNILTAIFPEILFVDTISIRDIASYEEEVDYYFSTDAIVKTEKPVFLLRNLLSTLAEKQRFRQRILEETNNFGESLYDLGKMEDLFRHFEDKNQAKRVLAEVLEIVNERRPKIFNQRESIFSTIKDMSIQIFQNESWQEVVQSLGNILIEKKIIAQRYIDEVLRQYTEITPQIALRETIALPHVASEFEVYGTGLAMGIVKEGICFKKTQSIYLVILFATNTKEAIAETMLELVQLSGQTEVIEKLKKSTNAKEARGYLEEYLREEVI
ncbi:Transcriptional antiterminator [Pilibacter termitis]|uniref:Ascorbate-specific PTS system EIIA component n=1 Tax=Pilibacter termitis TaxID=263852 RepID=A0A1T4LYQ0_9ENTE|nr:PTS sugar transporter subunit IIA [Pilibacter termitis]SJZ59782.1 Transcriptional antiterminator [Pilibacter termitis]